MKRMFSVVSLIVLFAISCSDKETLITDSGTKIELLASNGGKSLVDSTILLIKMTYSNEKGELLWSTPEDRNIAIPIYFEQWKKSGLLYEVLGLLKVGDSAKFKVNAQDLYQNSLKTDVPDSINANEFMTIVVKYDTMMTAIEFRHMKEKETLYMKNSQSDVKVEKKEMK